MTHHQHTPLQIAGGFSSLELSSVIEKALNKAGYEQPTPIQAQAIPLILQGHDVLGLAQTGTGKTAAFGLPLIEQLLGVGSKPASKTVRALILSPTRELANQIAVNLTGFLRQTHLRITTVVGGRSIGVQQKQLDRGTDILVATPGRLLDLTERKAVDLSKVRYLVLDEADQMLDLGFIHALRKIASMVPSERQTLLFSATMAREIEQLAQAFLREPVKVSVSPPGKPADNIRQGVQIVGQRDKQALLTQLLGERPEALSLVFSRTKHGAERIKRNLEKAGFAAGSIHGNKSQNQRDRAIKAFKSGELRVLVATDVAARGIDIQGVTHVFNYDLPEVAAVYVHRIGRTARAGASGEAIAFCSPEEGHLLKAIERLLKMPVAVLGKATTSSGADPRQVGDQDSATQQRESRPTKPAKPKSRKKARSAVAATAGENPKNSRSAGSGTRRRAVSAPSSENNMPGSRSEPKGRNTESAKSHRRRKRGAKRRAKQA